MDFFVPYAADADQAAAVLKATRDFLASQRIRTTDESFWRISFRHNSKLYDLEVGRPHPDLNEEVLVILRDAGRPLYYACTANRGVVRGSPYLIGDGPATAAVRWAK